MAQEIQTRFILRNDSEQNWTQVAETAILLKGEPAILFTEDGKAKLKIGDGITPWIDLPFVSGEGGTAVLPEKFFWGTLSGAVGTDQTENTSALNLTKPATTDIASITTLNQNLDKIDNAYTTLDTKMTTTQKRVDTLVSKFTDGATTFDNAELLDIREGYDGISYSSAGEAVRNIGYSLKDLQNNIGNLVGDEMVNGLMYEDSKLYLTSNGVVVGDPVIITGGSGGGGGSTYTITLTNMMDSRVLSYAKGESVKLSFKYKSADNENIEDGPGILTVYVNSVKKATLSARQGVNEIDITQYLPDGSNQIRLTVTNSEGNVKTLAYTISVLALAVTTTFPSMGMYSGNVQFPYIVTGAGEKTIHFVIDKDILGTDTTPSSGRSRIFNLENISDGAHILKVWADVENEGQLISSEVLYIGMIFTSSSMTDQAVLINYQGSEITQGDILTIPYMIYDPFTEDVEITLNIYNEDKALYSSKKLTVDHNPKTWVTQDFPAGANIKFEIICGNTANSISLTVKESDFHQTVIQDDSLVLNFTAANRSNSELQPEEWHYNDIVATFNGFGWEGADGWVEDSAGQTVLRFLPDDTMFIPFKPFAEDFRRSGYTIEAEIATHNVRDYDSIVLESLEGGIGFQIKSQQANLSSEQSKVSIQFKEDSKVRLTFVVEQQTLNRFIYIYINGVMCGVTQYSTTDNFKQVNPAGITIGAESCGLDLYVLRIYRKGLNRHEQLNNFICDRATLADRKTAYERNNILNENEQVSLETLPLSIPYMILECEELPQFKGDKKKNKSLTYVEPLHPERSFTATGVQFNVQGTSSQGYPVKNYKADCKKGIVYTQTGETAKGWPINVGDLLTTCFCLKADFASSENANNTCLAEYYDELVPYKTPPQKLDERVQTTVRGNPIVVFWKNTTNNEITFLGKYNCNVDKSNENLFGFDRQTYPNLECWELRNNTSNRTLFKSADYSSLDSSGNPAWLSDFEIRYPELDPRYTTEENEVPYTDSTALKRLADWLITTDREPVDDENNPIILSEQEKAARLQKFKDEYPQYLTLEPFIYYYVFTEVFLMVDSRAKNLFLTTWDGTHWEPFCYDLDTAIGINNEGALVFGYDLEDTDLVDGAQVFNGQKSTLWCNIRDAFPEKIKAMYQDLRSTGKFSYEVINTKMANHQEMWPEVIWNEDEYNKYINSYLVLHENYLEMLQGDKKSQRDWWLFNTFRYRDSKYQTGDAQSNFITLRCYDTHSITVTPYSNIWPRVSFGGINETVRGKRNTSYTFECPLDQMNDTECYIYSADRLASVGDLSPLNVGVANFSMATKLQDIILGSHAEGYQNTNLTSVSVGSNELLTTINVENCVKLSQPINMSGCHGLETVLAKGSKLTGINFPNGGHLKTLELPATFANLTIQNQKHIQHLVLEGQDELKTLRIENTPNIDIESLVNNSPALNRVRLVGVDWTATSQESLRTSINKLKACDGLDATGETVEGKPIVSGRVRIDSITDEFLEEINDVFPELIVVVNGVAKFFVKFLNYDNTLLYRYICQEGQEITDPIINGNIEQPTRADTEDSKYEWKGWSENLPITAAGKAYNIVAKFSGTYLVKFVSLDGNVLWSSWVKEGATVEDPKATGRISAPTKPSTEKYRYEFKSWDKPLTNITSAQIIGPVFDEILKDFPVYFFNGTEKILETRVFYGQTARYTDDTSTIKKKINGQDSPYYEFSGWRPDVTQPITSARNFYAQFSFNGYIEDSWAQIAENCKNGTIDAYGYGGRKKLSYIINGLESDVEVEIVGINHDTLTSTSADYNGGSDKASLTFMVCQLGKDKTRANNNPVAEGDNSAYSVGGWEKSTLREYCNTTLFASLPDEIKNIIKPVNKISDGGYYNQTLKTTSDKIWVPSDAELNGEIYGSVVMGQGTPYALYTNADSRIKANKVAGINLYWTRSTGNNPHYWRYVDMNGNINNNGAGSFLYGVCWGFCV